MSDDDSHSYEDGLREGRLVSLEITVKEQSKELDKLKIAIYMLYGAIALVQFLPEVRDFVANGGP